MKVEVRAVTHRLDALRDKIDQNSTDQTRRMDDLRRELTGRIGSVDARVDTVHNDLSTKIDTVRNDLTAKIDTVRNDLTAKIDTVRDSIASAKVWALMLYLALAGSMLFVMARGFKWL